ncbi:hypothetical protein M0R89_03165 [Halorussus limi]|uniref:histidine kinase n=1 Tax=Halorussus limi TaxID=2938695 RepID=A0A8U0HWM2_9EURY|nr:histidine kinase dimerization/phospho-acceptor domain-containing protein [Halorussus limi]UPV75076.1 hypothetical protein M0R89_03165 [Halorussus limi]
MVNRPYFRGGPNWGRVISALGLLYVAVSVGRFAAVVGAGDSLTEALLNFVQVGGPGIVLLYGGIRLPDTELRPEAYPRVVAWCLGGAAVLLGVVGLLLLDPDVNVNHLLWSTVLAAAVGNLGGLAIGANEARAISRAREAEDHERELQRQNDRLESFASMLAHELRNPLNVAQIYLPRAAAGGEDAAAEVEAAHDRIEEMINIMLVTARNTDSCVERERVSLGDIAAEAWADLPARRANLVVETDRSVRADPVHLRHLLENLFGNAVEHGDESVTVRERGRTRRRERDRSGRRPPIGFLRRGRRARHSGRRARDRLRRRVHHGRGRHRSRSHLRGATGRDLRLGLHGHGERERRCALRVRERRGGDRRTGVEPRIAGSLASRSREVWYAEPHAPETYVRRTSPSTR